MGRKKKDYSNGYSGADPTFGSDPFAAPNQSKTPNGYSWTDVVDETGRDKKNASKTTTASQTQSKTSSRPKKKKPGFESSFEAYESPYSKSPGSAAVYDWAKEHHERMQRLGVPTTSSPNAYQNGDTFKIIKDGGATEKDYSDFFEGFESIYEDYEAQRKPGDFIRKAKDYMPDFSRSTQPQRKYYYDAEGYIGEVKPVPEYVQTAIRNAEIHPLSDMIRRNSTAPNKRLNYDFSTLRAYPQEPELYRQPYTGKDRRTELYGEKWGEGLDAASDTLAIASIIPGLDTYADLAAIPVDLLRGDYVSAGLDAIGAIPFVGEAADSAKLARIGFKAADAADAVHDVAKAADVVGDSINGAKNFSLKTAGNAGELATPYSADKIPDEVKRYLSDLTQYGDSIDVDLTPSFENISLMARQEAAEFASVTIGNRNIIIRGDINGTYISEELLEDMIKNKGILNCHSHPYIGDLQPSESDLWLAEVLNHQETFRIVTPDGMQAVYTAHGLQSVGPIERKLSEADMKELYNLFGG